MRDISDSIVKTKNVIYLVVEDNVLMELVNAIMDGLVSLVISHHVLMNAAIMDNVLKENVIVT